MPKSKSTKDALAGRARSWLMDAAFPLWTEKGVDARGGFVERLSLDLEQVDDDATRVRVQARQTYAFAVAHRMGFRHGRELARMGADRLVRLALADGRLPGRLMASGGGRIGHDVELYDCAFTMMALFEVAAATGDGSALAGATEAFARIVRTLRLPDGEGFRERLPGDAGSIDGQRDDRGFDNDERVEKPPREQNPHMHLFEACLAGYRATRDIRYLDEAAAIGRFVFTNFYRRDLGLVELHRRGASVADNRIEPGHLFEWSWLLRAPAAFRNAAARDLEADLPAGLADDLLRRAEGLATDAGRVLLAHDLQGAPIDPRARTWTATEALRGAVAAWRAGRDGASDNIERFGERLFDDHLRDDGAWMDMVDIDGAPLSEDVTAASLYHIVGALDALISATAER
ncbi:MAG: hypothetical protein GC152_06865 [Alphaproteobacteria bacterium]|nr:hypothetical protein [Alphaproteobacteria bacterium]